MYLCSINEQCMWCTVSKWVWNEIEFCYVRVYWSIDVSYKISLKMKFGMNGVLDGESNTPTIPKRPLAWKSFETTEMKNAHKRNTHWPEGWVLPWVYALSLAFNVVSNWLTTFGVSSLQRTERTLQMRIQNSNWRTFTIVIPTCNYIYPSFNVILFFFIVFFHNSALHPLRLSERKYSLSHFLCGKWDGGGLFNEI